MKVALISSPMVKNKIRGSGVYERKLIESLKKNPDLEVTEIPFGFWRADYSQVDLVHFLYFDPFFLTLPPFRNRKTIVTLMDLTQIKFPDLFPRGIKGEIKWQIQKSLLSAVNHIMTLSNSSKNDIKNILGIEKNKVTVTYLAGDEFKKVTDTGILNSIKSKYGFTKKFIMFVGDVNPNKNIGTLVKALAGTPKDKRPMLLLAGKSFLDKNLNESQQIKNEVLDLGLSSEVIFPGFVSDSDLSALFSLASAYVQPSIYEGFGLPVVQAMNCGCPVICGDNSSLPEIGGEAAIYAAVDDSSDLANKIQLMLNLSKSDKEKLELKLLEQSKKFSWSKTAEVTFEAYKNLL